jgi:preprotein translocase SecE subunit
MNLLKSLLRGLALSVKVAYIDKQWPTLESRLLYLRGTGVEARKPRIRKTAPTVRERMEAAQAETEKVKPQRARRLLSKAAAPIKIVGKPVGKAASKARLPQNRFGNALRKIGRFIKKILGWLVPRYFINSWREVRQVAWPSRRETWRLTGAVFVFAIVFGLIIAGVDRSLDELFKKFILK